MVSESRSELPDELEIADIRLRSFTINAQTTAVNDSLTLCSLVDCAVLVQRLLLRFYATRLGLSG